MFKDLTNEQIQDGLNKVAQSIPEGKKGALLIYGDRSEANLALAWNEGNGWEVYLNSSIKLDDVNHPDVDLYFGVKKVW